MYKDRREGSSNLEKIQPTGANVAVSVLLHFCLSRALSNCRVFVSTKFHFDETIILAGLVSSSFVVVRATFMETLRWDNFGNFGATFLRFGTQFPDIILLWIQNLKKN